MKSILTIAALTTTVLAGVASATTVNTTYQTSGNPFGTDNLRQVVRVQSPELTTNVYAGLYQMTGDNGFGNFAAFCVDLAEWLHDPVTYTTQPRLFGAAVRDNVAKLYNSVLGGSTVADVIDTSLEAAGFQVALWEIVTETGSSLDVSDGAFSVSQNSGVANMAQFYLDNMGTAATDGYEITFLYNDGYQDLVTVSPVPVPAAGLFLLTGFGGLAFLRRRKKA
ncbi:VPLPA-CTERM sorting domain-containing protein [Sedimentitalea todarodis]|uniref:VPLPA-CTERM sorting domain-containing protein n=1 Tax=Sedimentitalea todarodis TaxID=1631240 RepID=A0ABU3VAD7_9RHOB|nr:VPLPA-CTERM sorting domain-containing protein [Sedimentitalea todarodis]MDU9003132.1 VPLPA-CTERM sorting domain-containing protein [Sedimentitalea todarodis]